MVPMAIQRGRLALGLPAKYDTKGKAIMLPILYTIVKMPISEAVRR